VVANFLGVSRSIREAILTDEQSFDGSSSGTRVWHERLDCIAQGATE
jgi:hypothetical protein